MSVISLTYRATTVNFFNRVFVNRPANIDQAGEYRTMSMSTETHILNAEYRDRTGKGVARKLRAVGKIPAVCYGHQIDGGMSLVIDPQELKNGLRSPYGHNTLFMLKVGDTGHNVVLKDHQQAVISNKLLHVDLLSIDLTKPVQVAVPIKLTGKAPGVMVDGGLLDVVRQVIDVECLPTNIPLSIEVSLDDMQLGQVLHVSDIVPPGELTVITPGRLAICTCSAPVAAEEETEAVEGQAEAVATVDAEGGESKPSHE